MGKKAEVAERSHSNDMMKPPHFSGEGDDIESVSGEWLSWKASMNNYISYAKALDGPMTKEQEMRIRASGLRGYAMLCATDRMDNMDSPSWKDVEEYLDSIFLGSVNTHALIASLKAIKQTPGQSVSQYASQWGAVHRRLIKVGVSNRDVAAQWFVDGLIHPLGKRVNEKLLEDQPLKELDVNDAVGAVAKVTNIALAKEMGMSRRPERDNGRWSSGGGNGPQNWRQSGGQRSGTARQSNMLGAQVNSMAVDFATLLGVSRDNIQKRMRAKECLTCGSNAHQIRGCPKVRQANINCIEAEEEMYNKSKNE